MKVNIETNETDTHVSMNLLFNTNTKEELEVMIYGLQKITEEDKCGMSEEQRSVLSMCLGTLSTQLWNRYYRWDK